MGTPYAHSWLKTQSCDLFEAQFGVVQPHSGKVFAQFHKFERKVNSPQYTGNRETLCFSRRIGAEEVDLSINKVKATVL